MSLSLSELINCNHSIHEPPTRPGAYITGNGGYVIKRTHPAVRLSSGHAHANRPRCRNGQDTVELTFRFSVCYGGARACGCLVCVGCVGGELRLGTRDEPGRRVCDYGRSHLRGGWRLLVLLDWARGLDGVFFLTRREHHCASAGTALGLLLLTVRVVVFMKSCLPASKVGSQRSASALTADGGALPDQVRVVCS